jgi:hypothetical protein
MFQQPLTRTIAAFLTDIGIGVAARRLDGQDCFLPGILVEHGALIVDEATLTYPGDLLHEAGHLAAVPAASRAQLSGDVALSGWNMQSLEAAATAWAYAAVIHLGLDARVLFHEGGYHGRSAGLLQTYRLGVYPGANGLEEFGMTATGERARAMGVAPYPHMLRWTRD